MNANHLQAVSVTLQALPVAMTFSGRLLPERSLGAGKPSLPEFSGPELELRATFVTKTLKEIRGYYHGGINE